MQKANIAKYHSSGEIAWASGGYSINDAWAAGVGAAYYEGFMARFGN